MGKRVEEAVAKAVARCDPQRAAKICLEMTERDPFLVWEVQEEAMQAFIEKFVHEAIGDGFSLEDPDALGLEIILRQCHEGFVTPRPAPAIALNAADEPLAVVINLDERTMAVGAVLHPDLCPN